MFHDNMKHTVLQPQPHYVIDPLPTIYPNCEQQQVIDNTPFMY